MRTKAAVVISVAAGVAAAVLLAGCTSKANASAPIDHASSSSNHVPIGIPDGEVGRAPITSISGESLGTIVFTNTAKGVRLGLPATGFGDAETVALADSPFSPTACGSDNVWELGFDLRDPNPHILEPGMFAGGDPSFYTAVVISQSVVATGSECSQKITATGPITWTIPLQRPWVHPVDGGAAPGAHGTVTRKNGKPSLYATAVGDTWTAIAGRFGISGDDLDWLNPTRLGGSTSGEAYAKQLLNLDPTDRGDSESRRPH